MTEAVTGSVRVLVADDHTLVRRGTREMLDAASGIDVVGEASDGIEAVSLARELEPDVILMDVGMPGMDGLGAMRAILADRPSTRVVMLSVHPDREYVVGAIRDGAAGYLLKSVGEADLASAVRDAAGGKPVLDESLGGMALEASRSDGKKRRLSPRQREVLLLVADGLSNREIGEQLGMSDRTVEVHLRNVFDRLGVASRTEAVVAALRKGWLELDG